MIFAWYRFEYYPQMLESDAGLVLRRVGPS